jgi:4-hydroxy-3-polyprenylbenzoate decarboxylase
MVEKEIILGISGASGIILGVKILELLKPIMHIKTHLIMSKSAEITLKTETKYSISDIQSLADFCHNNKNIGACIASGSYNISAMIIAPCSIKTMSEIANGVTTSLLSRSADVCLKERKKLILGVREMPFHASHLRNMALLSDLGAYIAPPVLEFYTNPKTIDDIVTQISCRWLSFSGIELTEKKVWTGL